MTFGTTDSLGPRLADAAETRTATSARHREGILKKSPGSVRYDPAPPNGLPRYGPGMRLLVHSATGPENATRAALALLVARTAAEEGHEVAVFLAGDAVHLAREATAGAVSGAGTGAAGEHIAALRDAGVTLHLSGMSSKARGVEAGDGMELCPPAKLIELTDWAEKVLTY